MLRLALFPLTASLAASPQHVSSVKSLNEKGAYAGNEKRKKIADAVAQQVERDSRQNLKISGLFEDYEQEDAKTWREVKANKNLLALNQMGNGPRHSAQVPVDAIRAQIEAERDHFVDIHTPFAENEAKETTEWREVKADHNLKAFMQKGETSLLQTKTSLKDDDDPMEKYLRDYSKNSADAETSSDVEKSTNVEKSSSDSTSDDSTPTFAWAKIAEETPSTTDSNSFSHTSHSSAFDPTDYSQDIHHSHNYGGSVISIPLSSQIQVSSSFLQKKTGLKRVLAKNAPGVEEEVAKEKAWDVYLSDDFARQEKEDVAEVKKLKARKEYGQ